jgi:hypothetical protein
MRIHEKWLTFLDFLLHSTAGKTHVPPDTSTHLFSCPPQCNHDFPNSRLERKRGVYDAPLLVRGRLSPLFPHPVRAFFPSSAQFILLIFSYFFFLKKDFRREPPTPFLLRREFMFIGISCINCSSNPSSGVTISTGNFTLETPVGTLSDKLYNWFFTDT